MQESKTMNEDFKVVDEEIDVSQDQDIKISEELAHKLIVSQFPQLSSLPIKKLGEGLDNTVYHVGEGFVFRFPRYKDTVPGLKREGKILPKLAEMISISFPKPLFYGESHLDYPFPFLGYTYLSGSFPIGISDEQRSLSIATLAQFLKKLHSFPLETAREMGVVNDGRNLLNIKARKEHMFEFLNMLSTHLQDDEEQMISSYLHQIDIDFVEPKEVFLHGDLHFKNIVVNEAGEISGIIDWGDMGIGHPGCDLSAVYSFLPAHDRPSFFKEYGEVDEETKILSRFIAVFIAMVLLLQAIEDNDKSIAEEAKATIRRALAE